MLKGNDWYIHSSLSLIGGLVEGEYTEVDGVGIVTPQCENIGVTFDGPEFHDFIQKYVIPTADPRCRDSWRALL